MSHTEATLRASELGPEARKGGKGNLGNGERNNLQSFLTRERKLSNKGERKGTGEISLVAIEGVSFPKGLSRRRV